MNTTVAETKTDSTNKRRPAKPEIKLYAGIAAFVLIVAAVTMAGPRLLHGTAVHTSSPQAPVVTVSRPLQREVHGRIQLLGQFSAVDEVELRAQVGGTLWRTAVQSRTSEKGNCGEQAVQSRQSRSKGGNRQFRPLPFAVSSPEGAPSAEPRRDELRGVLGSPSSAAAGALKDL